MNKDNYVDKLIDFLSSKKRLRFLINECLVRVMKKKKEDFISKILKDKSLLKGDEIDIVSVIKKYLLKVYTTKLSLLYFKAEKDQFFSCLLSSNMEKPLWENEKEDTTFIEKNAKAYLDKLDFDDGITKITEKLGANDLVIMLGLKLPGIKPAFDNVTKLVSENISKGYRINENNLRTYLENEYEEVKAYFRELETCDNSTANIIDKEPKFLSIIKETKI